MSKILKGIGKVFKKIIKVAKVVLPIALAVAAVVFTGGAALGVLPTFATAVGGVVTGLGIGGAVAGALTGAVVSAGFGSAIGGVTSAATGRPILKGMQMGALTGAVTGGAMGAINPAAFGVVRGADGAWTTMGAIRTGTTFGAAGSGVELVKNAAGQYVRAGANALSGPIINTSSASLGGATSATTGATGSAVTGGLNAGGALPATGLAPSGIGTGFDTAFNQLGAAQGAATAPGVALPSTALPGITPPATPGVGGAFLNTSGSGLAPSAGGLAGPISNTALPAAATNGFTAPLSGPIVNTAGAGGGVMGFVNQNPFIAGSMLNTLGGALGGSDDPDYEARFRAEGDEARRMGMWAFGGVYSGNPNPFGQTPYPVPPGGWVFNPETLRVEERRV